MWAQGGGAAGERAGFPCVLEPRVDPTLQPESLPLLFRTRTSAQTPLSHLICASLRSPPGKRMNNKDSTKRTCPVSGEEGACERLHSADAGRRGSLRSHPRGDSRGSSSSSCSSGGGSGGSPRGYGCRSGRGGAGGGPALLHAVGQEAGNDGHRPDEGGHAPHHDDQGHEAGHQRRLDGLAVQPPARLALQLLQAEVQAAEVTRLALQPQRPRLGRRVGRQRGGSPGGSPQAAAHPAAAHAQAQVLLRAARRQPQMLDEQWWPDAVEGGGEEGAAVRVGREEQQVALQAPRAAPAHEQRAQHLSLHADVAGRRRSLLWARALWGRRCRRCQQTRGGVFVGEGRIGRGVWGRPCKAGRIRGPAVRRRQLAGGGQ
jgi:hypothetical protein